MPLVFEQAQIGRGLKPVAQHGKVEVGHGKLTLLGTKGDQIATGPLEGVEAHFVRFTRKQTLSITVGGEKFNVTPAWGTSPAPGLRLSDAGPQAAAQALLDAIEGRLDPDAEA